MSSSIDLIDGVIERIGLKLNPDKYIIIHHNCFYLFEKLYW